MEQIYQIASHLLTSKNFVRYPYHEKQDMMQEAVLKCLANLKNFKPEKGIIFSYFTRCCWTAFVVHLGRYYKGINRRREEILAVLEGLDEKQIGAREHLEKLMKNIDETLALYTRDAGAKRHGRKTNGKTDGGEK